jgi:hypothetical protein
MTKKLITLQLAPGLDLPYAAEAEQALPPGQLAQWNTMVGAFGGAAPTLRPCLTRCRRKRSCR